MGVTALMGGAALAGGGLQAFGASKAASAQKKSAMISAMVQQNMFNQGMDYLKGRAGIADVERQANLNPFISGGQNAFATLQGLTGTNAGGNPLTAPLTRPFQPTMEELAATPGYQFTLQQGQQAVQNSAAAKGLGTSGAALRGAADYAEGLAGTTYQQQFQNYLAQNQQIYNMLGGQANTGLSAAGTGAGLATNLASVGANALQSSVSAGQGIGSSIQAGGNAQAAGTLGAFNSLANGLVGGAANIAYNPNGIFGGGGAFGTGGAISNITGTSMSPSELSAAAGLLGGR